MNAFMLKLLFVHNLLIRQSPIKVSAPFPTFSGTTKSSSSFSIPFHLFSSQLSPLRSPIRLFYVIQIRLHPTSRNVIITKYIYIYICLLRYRQIWENKMTCGYHNKTSHIYMTNFNQNHRYRFHTKREILDH